MGSHTRTPFHRPAAADRAFFDTHGYTEVPQVVQWLATLRCPLACAHCLAADDGRREMTTREAADLIDQVAAAGIPEFLVTGGEPLVREDLPVLVERLGHLGQRWSLNTAMAPTPEQRRALTAAPPSFVAVSLDGPPAVHNAFRGRPHAYQEAIEAMAFFASLPGCQVCAGTTVTQQNFSFLQETFDLVRESAATSWGLHLLLPEGRAATRRDLFLDRGQLKSLVRFTARKRRYFPVSLADEFGFCGDWEPLLRDAPLQCGAGIAQCVVLPDGDLVPCTTLDPAVVQGNVRTTDLMTLWQEGFAELRRREPDPRCRDCRFEEACRGGCWLQRRAGEGCHKPVWEVPGLLKTAAGVALCLGLAGAAQAEPAEEAPKPVPTRAEQPARPVLNKKPAAAGKTPVQPNLDLLVLHHYAKDLPVLGRPGTPAALFPIPTLAPMATDDPGFQVLQQCFSGALHEASLEERSAALDKALTTKQRSLGLVAVLWRMVQEPLLAGPSPEKRRGTTREAVARATLKLGATALAWRAEIVEGKLDPYLERGRLPLRHRFEMSKAYRPAPPWVSLGRDTDQERYGRSTKGYEPDPITTEFLDHHPYAEEMQLTVSRVAGTGGKLFRPKGEVTLDSPRAMRLFDILRAPEGKEVNLAVSWSQAPRFVYKVTLAAHADYTYLDLLKALHRQQAKALRKAALKRPDIERPLPNPLHLFLYQEAAATPIGEGTRPDPLKERAVSYLADFFLF